MGLPIVEIAPEASCLLQSLRGMGYSPETALADLIDNSIAAEATRIEVWISEADGEVQVCVLDDGGGLRPDQLREAMRFGGGGPGRPRAPDDLGRFGLGLKTASLSQCRRLTVASRRDGATGCIAWDVDEVERSGRWEALTPKQPPECPLSDRFEAMEAGTLVVWDRMDELGGLFGLERAALFDRIRDIRAHFSMVFHRFLSGEARRIRILVNDRMVKPWDPFQRAHPATRALAADRRKVGRSTVTISPFVLPHRDRFDNEQAFAEAGGVGGWSERQGFYVYRGDRLVVAGGWLGLGGSRAWTRDEASRLSRIAVDLPTDLDGAWRIDIRKSSARPPAALRNKLTAMASHCRAVAREVFAFRGGAVRRVGTGAGSTSPLWLMDMSSGPTRYKINREHPAVAAALADARTTESLKIAMALIERTVPVEQIWLDISESATATAPLEGMEEAALAADLAAVVMSMNDDRDPAARLDDLLSSLRIGGPTLRDRVLSVLDDE